MVVMGRPVLLLVSAVVLVKAAPGKVVQVQGAAGAGVGPYSDDPITLDAGNVGVNLGGFHASAGLGGLLTGDFSKGGLHAEAGTPFGQQAGAGVGYTDANGNFQFFPYAYAVAGGIPNVPQQQNIVNSIVSQVTNIVQQVGQIVNSKAGGGLYAGATAGGGVSAGAGLAGGTGGGVGVAGAEYGHKTIIHRSEVIAEKRYTDEPKVVAERTLQDTPQVHRTVIEKTVIPQYVEKTIQVPSYVEKTIRVPTVVEKRVRVEAAPKVEEKTYDVDGAYGGSAGFYAGARVGGGASARAQARAEARARAQAQAQFDSFGQGQFYGSMTVEKPRAVVSTQFAPRPIGATAGFGVVSGGAAAGTHGTLFNDIFNIPISALGAVNNLLNGLSGGASAGFAVSKNYHLG